MKFLKSSKFSSFVWIFLTLFGIFTLFSIINRPSETDSAFLFGFSKIRLLIFLFSLIALIIILFITISHFLQPKWWQSFVGKLSGWINSENGLFIGLILGVTPLLIIITIQILFLSPVANKIVILKTIQTRIGFLLVWIELIILTIFFPCYIKNLKTYRTLFTPFRKAILFLILTIFYFSALKLFAFYSSDLRFRGMEKYIFLPAIIFLVWAWIYQIYSAKPWYQKAQNLLISLAIIFVVFAIYRHTAQWMDWLNTPSKSYWDLLADAFLHGRLYLTNLSNTHDLTFYQGQWYVPNPPLPAFILMPFVAIWGLPDLNMVIFSIWSGAITVLLVFWLLESGSSKGLIATNRIGNLWVTTVFAIGTCFWWLSIMGRMWFVSQIFTVMFTVLAAILVINKKSPFLVGAALGLAVLARPNVFTIWPFLLGIFMYLENTNFPKISWQKVIVWSIKSAIPICLSVGGLLYYNYIRFDDFFDFGYVTINGAASIVEAVQTYGMFHPHFIPINFSVMFLKHPFINIENGCFSFNASTDGYGLFFMTPALLYIFRRYRKNWWFIGAWISILFTVGLLLMYHNSGSAQIGFRYLTDFIVPILLLLALGIGEKPSWIFKLLAIVSIVGNLFGIIWWFQKWWC